MTPTIEHRIVVYVILYGHVDPHSVYSSIFNSTLVILTVVSDIIRKTEDVTLFSVMSYWSSGRIVIFNIVV